MTQLRIFDQEGNFVEVFDDRRMAKDYAKKATSNRAFQDLTLFLFKQKNDKNDLNGIYVDGREYD